VKTLYVFDFDDTLAWTDSHVRVFRSGRLHRTLKPHQYAKYQKQPGDEVDYSDFANLIDPEVIELTMDTMMVAYKRGEHVMILTARGPSAKRDIHAFLADNGVDLPMSDIVTLNDSNPAAKGEFVARVVVEEGFDSVEFFDDSESNVQAVYDMVGEVSPETMVAAHHVVHEQPGVKGSDVMFRRLIREILLLRCKNRIMPV
jgi:acid phosphatase class B